MRAALILVLAAAALVAMPAGAQVDTFRMTDLDLRDPHVYADIGFCVDVTENVFNNSLQQEIQTDGDGDGNLDASYVVQFMPLDQSQATNFAVAGVATCTAPAASTTC